MPIRIAVLLGAWLSPLLVQAQVQVDVHESSDCVSESEVRADVQRLVDRPLQEYESVVTVLIEVRESDDDVFGRIELTVDAQATTRELQATSCDGLASAAAVMIALALGPVANEPLGNATLPQSQSESPPLSEVEPMDAVSSSQPLPAELPTLPEAEPASDDPSSFATVSAGIDVGTMSAPAPGFGLGVGLALGSWRVEAGARLLVGTRAVADRPGARIDLEHYSGFASLGFRFSPLSWLALGPFIELEVGVITGSAGGLRIQAPQEATLLWFALRGGPFLEVIPTEVVSLRLSGTVGTPLLRPEFTVQGLGTLFEPDDLLVSGAFSILVRFS